MGGIVWLASYPKSGNTWTRSFLHNALRAESGDHDINAMRELTAWDCASVWYAPFLPRPVEQCSKDEIAAIRPRAIAGIAESTEDLVFVKTHNAMVADRGTPMINLSVTAGAVYIVRNPLDVAVSYSHHLGRSVDDAIEHMNLVGAEHATSENTVYEVQGSWSEHVHSWTRKPHPSMHVMRYEDMLAEPRATFGRLVDFLEIRIPPERLARAIDSASFDKLRAQERERGFHEKPVFAKEFFREGRAGQWRDVLSRRQVRRIVDANREQMARFGYLRD